jgi:predicted acyl esterase
MTCQSIEDEMKNAILILTAVCFVCPVSADQPGVSVKPRVAEPKMEMAPMRDAVGLSTNIFLPEGTGPWPTILQRTPYGKSIRGEPYVSAGYAYVSQDQRGRGDSEGEYRPHEAEIEDGYDTVEWIAKQPWCNGKVGMVGASASGIAANLAAASAPPHLTAAFIRVAPHSLFFEGRFIGGVFKEADTGNWMRRQGVAEDAIRAYKKRVILDDRWMKTDLVFHRDKIEIPIYNVGGWYDLFSLGSVSNFQYLQNDGNSGARGKQRLVMGPIGHGRLRGDLEYPNARLDADPALPFFDYWLKGIDNGFTDEPPISYYMMASARRGSPSPKNGWRTAQTWPPQNAQSVRFYLHDDSRLARTKPSSAAGASSYKFDPANPVPTKGGLNLTLPLGPMDQRKIGQRNDYLRFESEPLDEDLVVAGKIDLELWASTDGRDTDFMIKLVDVYPDGYEALVLDTALRTRYRFGRRAEDVQMMEANKPEKMMIDMWNTAITFEKGHRLAVHITSSNSPRFEVNPNTGDPPGEETTSPRTALNTVYHNADQPTAIVLSVLDPTD